MSRVKATIVLHLEAFDDRARGGHVLAEVLSALSSDMEGRLHGLPSTGPFIRRTPDDKPVARIDGWMVAAGELMDDPEDETR